MTVRDPSQYLEPAVIETINALGDLAAEDAALVKLCKHYARTIDSAPAGRKEYVTRWIGPELHRALESLNASPAARARLRPGAGAPAPDNPLAKLRSVPF